MSSIEDLRTAVRGPVIEPGDDGTGAPRDPARFAADFAARVNALIADPERARAMGRAGRERAVSSFAWPAIARQTSQLYRALVETARDI